MKKKFSQVFKSIRFAKLDPNHDKGPKGSSDDEEHYAVSQGEWEQQIAHAKKRAMQEEVELQEGRPSQRHPLEGHEYHKKSDAELEYIAKDAHKAAEAMKSHNTTAENKYRDQANDSATVRYFRKKNGMPEWYKKKYGHVKEEVEQIEELSSELLGRYKKAAGEDASAADKAGDYKKGDKRFSGIVKATKKQFDNDLKKEETTPPFDGPYKKSTGVVTDKSGAKHGPMSQARNLARQAMKAVGEKQKKSLKPAKPFNESKKTEIVKDVIKGKKTKDKFEAEPIISSSPDSKGTIDN